jgi:hypothetical protein
LTLADRRAGPPHPTAGRSSIDLLCAPATRPPSVEMEWNWWCGLPSPPPHKQLGPFGRQARRRAARWYGVLWRFAFLVRFGSRVQSIPSNGSTQDETRERTTCPLVIARHCLVSSGLHRACKPYRERVGCSNPNTPPRPHFRFIRVRGAWMCPSLPSFLSP